MGDRVLACLVPRCGLASFVSLSRRIAGPEVAFLGTTYRQASQRTCGGWRVYRQDTIPAVEAGDARPRGRGRAGV